MNKIVYRFVSISFSILVLLLVLIGFVKIGSFFYDFGYRVFTEAPVDAEPGRDVAVQITEDMSDMDIAKELEEKGLIEDSMLFFVQLKVSAYADKLNPGVYTLNTSMEARDMMVVMAAEPEEDADESTAAEETADETAADDAAAGE